MYNGLTVHFYVLHAISNILYLISRLCLYIYIYIYHIYIYVCVWKFHQISMSPCCGFRSVNDGFQRFLNLWGRMGAGAGGTWPVRQHTAYHVSSGVSLTCKWLDSQDWIILIIILSWFLIGIILWGGYLDFSSYLGRYEKNIYKVVPLRYQLVHWPTNPTSFAYGYHLKTNTFAISISPHCARQRAFASGSSTMKIFASRSLSSREILGASGSLQGCPRAKHRMERMTFLGDFLWG